MIEICSYKDCTGCGSCSNACKKGAIEIKPDEFGELHPVIDQSLCVDCKLCFSSCPNHISNPRKPIQDVYAAFRNNENKRKDSASGGIAAVLSERFVAENGIVFGAVLNSDLKPVLSSCDILEDLSRFKGSKYVQCYPQKVYSEIQLALNEGKKVLIIALPCQIDGLYSYLKKDYLNLYTVDLLCHGTSSPEYLSEYVNWIIKRYRIERVDNITFRSNIDRFDFRFCLWSEGKVVYRKPAYESLYFSVFLKGIGLRESCYQCKYKSCNRIGDLTIGDFIGLGKSVPYEYNRKRVSFVAVNSDKGNELCNYLFSDDVTIIKRDLSEALLEGRSLKESFPIHKKHYRFLKIYKDKGFVNASLRINGISIMFKFIVRCIDKARRIVFRVR